MADDPLQLFEEWYAAARATDMDYPDAMSLATADADGFPSVRIVLLKAYGPEGFVFYTNFESEKGRDLLENPRAALCFYWKELKRQVRLRGPVETVSAQTADAYFASRDRLSRIGAWASDQSRPMAHRLELEERVARYSTTYAVGEVPRPDHWSGFRLRPERIEFWEEKAFRLHTRRRFSKSGDAWDMEYLFP